MLRPKPQFQLADIGHPVDRLRRYASAFLSVTTSDPTPSFNDLRVCPVQRLGGCAVEQRRNGPTEELRVPCTLTIQQARLYARHPILLKSLIQLHNYHTHDKSFCQNVEFLFVQLHEQE